MPDALFQSRSEPALERSEAPTQPSLWSRFAAWVDACGRPQDMTLHWTCCGTPMRHPAEAYLGRVESSELTISSCTHCGALWLGLCSVATTVMRSEPLSRTDAEAFLAASSGNERRAMMHAWLERHARSRAARR